MKQKGFAKRISSSPFLPSRRHDKDQKNQPKPKGNVKLKNSSNDYVRDFSNSTGATLGDYVRIICGNADPLIARSNVLDTMLSSETTKDTLIMAEFSTVSVQVLLSILTVGSSQDKDLSEGEVSEVMQLVSQLGLDIRSLQISPVDNSTPRDVDNQNKTEEINKVNKEEVEGEKVSDMMVDIEDDEEDKIIHLREMVDILCSTAKGGESGDDTTRVRLAKDQTIDEDILEPDTENTRTEADLATESSPDDSRVQESTLDEEKEQALDVRYNEEREQALDVQYPGNQAQKSREKVELYSLRVPKHSIIRPPTPITSTKEQNELRKQTPDEYPSSKKTPADSNPMNPASNLNPVFLRIRPIDNISLEEKEDTIAADDEKANNTEEPTAVDKTNTKNMNKENIEDPAQDLSQTELIHDVVKYSARSDKVEVRKSRSDKVEDKIDKTRWLARIGRTLFNCPLCVFVGDTKKAVKEHMSSEHYIAYLLSRFSTEDITCKLCLKETSYKDNKELAKHIGIKHNKLKEVTAVHSKVYVVDREKVHSKMNIVDRERGPSDCKPCGRCSNCLDVPCGDCLACKELKVNTGVLNSTCYRRRCSGLQENPKHSDEKLLQSPDQRITMEVKKRNYRKRKLENSTETEKSSEMSLNNKAIESHQSPAKSLKVSSDPGVSQSVDSKYKCFICGFTVGTRSDLYEHYSLKHFYYDIIQKFKPMKVCPKCNLDISSERIWVCHLGKKHGIVDYFLPQKHKVNDSIISKS